ncbi:hypothetical protein MACK_001170 [Theileria orientalis]|uniref:Fcf2 pre-rRNA processing C-terminal domain-containing protein n=1 Tax=Theileria orientalis TaxID=68886 RepID=A0A976QT94_THEOR|nr:hypothetical protein MACK_001170 [Theileria orientalis]
MDSNTPSLTPDQLDLVKFGSLGSKKLRRLYFNSVKSNTPETSTFDPDVTATGTIGSKLENIANTNIDVKLNLDLNNYLKKDINSPSETSSPSISYSTGHNSTTVTRSKSATTTPLSPSKSLEYKKSNKKKDIEKEWNAISEAEPTHTALREWKSIQLRGFVDPKRFYKNMKNKLEEIPKQFQIGRIVDQSKSINIGNIDNNNKSTFTGSTNVSKSKKRTRKKPSLITNMLKEDKGWVSKRYNEIQSEKTKGSKGWYQRQLKKRKRG